MGWVMAHKEPPTEDMNEELLPKEELHEPSIEELDKVESIMATMAKHLEVLVQKSAVICDLDLETLGKDESLDPEVRKLFVKPRIDLAQKILNGYWSDKLPVFNDILCTRFPTILIDNKTSKNENASSSDSDWPPPLPEISNKDIEALVFMHSSVFNLHNYVSGLETTLRNNERLEFLGDSVLERAVCDLLYFHFPHDNEGQLTQKKIKMVANLKLDEFAILYKFDQRLYAHLQEETEINRKKNNKIFADTFEAYVGGLYEDKGYPVVQDWLYKLYAPILADLHAESTPQAVVKKEEASQAKSTLYKKIGSATRKIRYIEMTVQSPFTIECWIDDVKLGTGTGISKKEAGNNAAMDALSNTKLIDEQAEIRAREPRTAPFTTHVD